MDEKVLTTSQLITGYIEKGEKTVKVGELGDLSLLRGDFNILIGKNGVGKSTLLRTLSGEQLPLQGDVKINGQSLKKLDNSKKSHLISFVFSNASIVGKLSAFETVLMGRYPYVNWWGKLKEEDHAIAIQALEDVGALFLKDRFVSTLSDGERQKVMIARAIAQNTDIIFLDEPSAHLDLTNRIEVFHLLKNIARKRQKAILLSTHEIEMSLQIADQLWILHDHTITIGTPAKIVANNMINTIFSSPSIAFNPKNGVFNFCAPNKLFSYSLEVNQNVKKYNGTVNPMTLADWESKKLISEGAYQDQNPNFKIELFFKEDTSEIFWSIKYLKKEILLEAINCSLYKELSRLYSS